MLQTTLSEVATLTRKIRIVYFITSLEVGGSERQLANLLAGLPADRYEKHVVCLSGYGAMEESVRLVSDGLYDLGYPRLRKEGKLQISRFPTAALAFPRLVRLLRKLKPDILHTLIPVCNVIGSVSGRMAGVPHIVCTRLSLGDYRDKNALMARLEDWTDPLFQLVHCKSRGIMEDVARREPIPREKMRIVYNGLKTVPYEQRANVHATRASLQIPDGAQVVGSVANLHPYKGHVDIVRAAAPLVSQFPDLHLLFVGRLAGAEQQIRDEEEKLGIANRVILAGERSDVPALLQCMDVFVLASHEEGFSNAVLEAMASRRAVVATRVGGNMEQVADGVTGFLVPPKDPDPMRQNLTLLLSNPAKAQAMGDAGLERVRELFSYDAMITGMQRFYEEVVTGVSFPTS